MEPIEESMITEKVTLQKSPPPRPPSPLDRNKKLESTCENNSTEFVYYSFNFQFFFNINLNSISILIV
jgi:hypothetical protein